MTHFLLGFLSAVALIAVTVIVWAVIAHRRQERQRQQGINAIIGKIVADTPLPEGTRLELFRKQPSSSDTSVQGKKGVH